LVLCSRCERYGVSRAV